MSNPYPLHQEFENLVRTAYLLSTEVGKEVEEVLRAGLDRPLSPAESVELLGKVVTALKRNAAAASDAATVTALEGQGEAIVARIVAARQCTPATLGTNGTAVTLQARNGIAVRHVQPRPLFRGKEIPVK